MPSEGIGWFLEFLLGQCRSGQGVLSCWLLWLISKHSMVIPDAYLTFPTAGVYSARVEYLGLKVGEWVCPGMSLEPSTGCRRGGNATKKQTKKETCRDRDIR